MVIYIECAKLNVNVCNVYPEEKDNQESKAEDEEADESHSDEGESTAGKKGEVADLKYMSSDTDLARVKTFLCVE